MTLFLTSSPCDNNVPEGLDLPCIFDARNGFVENLRASVEPGAQLLIIASDPDAFAGNDEMAATFEGCFAAAEIELEDVCVLDSRNADDAAELVAQSGVILLSGGHVPTENAFFASIDLRDLLADFDGVIIGISAGSMNCADTVYAQPEEPGEAVDPDYQRFIPGLGLTTRNILPHYNQVRTMCWTACGSLRTSPLPTALDIRSIFCPTAAISLRGTATKCCAAKRG